MTERDSVTFDNGVDLVSDPSGLQGQWFASWEADLDHRFERSDLIAVVQVASIGRSELDSDDKGRFVLVPERSTVFKGSWPQDLTLVSVKHVPGYISVERGQSRLLQDTFILFVKWAVDAAGQVEARWHLSPAAGEVERNAQLRYGEPGSSKRVVRHVN